MAYPHCMLKYLRLQRDTQYMQHLLIFHCNTNAPHCYVIHTLHVLFCSMNPLKPNDHYMGRTASQTFKRPILYLYSTNIGSEYFKHGIYSPCFSLQNGFIILMYLVSVLYTFYIQGMLKLKNSGTKRLM
jgi:hypothetical protein